MFEVRVILLCLPSILLATTLEPGKCSPHASPYSFTIKFALMHLREWETSRPRVSLPFIHDSIRRFLLCDLWFFNLYVRKCVITIYAQTKLFKWLKWWTVSCPHQLKAGQKMQMNKSNSTIQCHCQEMFDRWRRIFSVMHLLHVFYPHSLPCIFLSLATHILSFRCAQSMKWKRVKYLLRYFIWKR